jgi:bile acid-coenzyme A ligase
MEVESSSIDVTNRPLTHLLRELADGDPDSPALSCAGETVTRANLDARSNRVARRLQAEGVGPGDVVSIALPNGIWHFEVTLGVWKVGATPQPLSPSLPRPERQAIVDLAKPQLIVGANPAEHSDRRCWPVDYRPSSDIPTDPLTTDAVSHVMSILTSGGSTGRPKLLASAASASVDPSRVGDTFYMPSNGTILLPSPLYQSAGFTWSWSGLVLGNHIVVLPKFDPVAALEAIERDQVEWVFLVPTMMSRMLRTIEQSTTKWDLSSLKVVWHGAAKCPPWVKEAWIDLVGGDRLMELYGASESPLGTTISGTEWLMHRGSVGRPPDGLVKIVGGAGEDLPPGEVGDIHMYAGPGVPKKGTFIGAEMPIRDDWMTVGDLGWLDPDGYLYISDRRVDMVVSGGFNVYPAEVEGALGEHPHVNTAVVVGLPDDDLGQRVHAVVEVNAPLSSNELVRFLEDRIVRYKIPRSIRIVHEPIRDDADKVRRSAVRDQEVALMAHPDSTASDPDPN